MTKKCLGNVMTIEINQFHPCVVQSNFSFFPSCVQVCKAKDHQAGFVGSVYLDCPNKPCYLCKQPGVNLYIVPINDINIFSV